MSKQRLTVSVDAELAASAAAAVAAGRADSVSAWVNDALADRVATERRLAALAGALADYEAEHGVITRDEVARQLRDDRDAAAAVRAQVRGRQGVA